MGNFARSVVPLVFLFAGGAAAASDFPYRVGAAIHDITGPAAEMMMAGYVDPKQRTSGIHMRLHSRAYVIVDAESGRRVVFVSAELAHLFQAVKLRVVEKLRDRFGTLYDEKNVLLTATHTHSGPGGYSHYKLYNLSSLGYSPQNFEIITEGIFQSIVQAHQNVAPAAILVNRGELRGAGRNRSPEAYRLNPAEERARYDSDTDPRMLVLRFQGADGTEIGAITWFALHPTSLPSSNTLISSDNKGYAAYLFEKAKGRDYRAERGFVAAFPNTNAGDVSPNTAGDLNGTGLWTCPLNEPFACNRRAGTMQYEKARELYDAASEPLRGGLDFRHAWVDFANLSVAPAYTGQGQRATCLAAIGLSMLAGTEDGRGIATEGRTCSHASALEQPLCIRDRCQGEKPVALETGRHNPPWTPDILPVQMFVLGELAIAALPVELTTMSGRRVLARLQALLGESGIRHVTISGYANAYAGYVATREEYQGQQYEGASTHFGEWTLAAYEQELARLAEAIRDGVDVASGPTPGDPAVSDPILGAESIVDAGSFGAVDRDARSRYAPGQRLSVSFWGAYPNNDPRIGGSYLEIQRRQGSAWEPIAWDWDPETAFHWERVGIARSRVTVEWSIPSTVEPGTYRVVHRGKAKSLGGALRAYTGVSRVFQVGE